MLHLAFVVPSIEQHLATAREKTPTGSLLLHASMPGLGRFVYVDGLVYGVLLDLIELQASR